MAKELFTVTLIFIAVLGCRFGSSNAASESNVHIVASDAETPRQDENLTANAADASASPTPTPRPANAVCPDPAKPCQHKEKHFDDWELSFKMPAKLKANKSNSSAPFYGIILKVYKIEDDCDGGEYIEAVEAERKQLQRENPGRKVFASYECPNMGAVDYDFPGKWDARKEQALVDNFMAIYAGESKEEAQQLLDKMKAKYPNANLKQMKATYEWIVQ